MRISAFTDRFAMFARVEMSVCEIPDDFGGGKTKHEFSEINPNNSFDRNCWMFDVQIRRERLKV